MLLQSNLNQHYQAALASSGCGDALKQQFIQFQQQPIQYPQQHSVSGASNPLFQHSQQPIQPLIPQQFMHGQAQIHHQVNGQPEEQQQQVSSQQPPNSFPEPFLIQHEQLQTKTQSNVPSQSFQKTEFMLGSLNTEGSGNPLSFSRTDQSSQHSWVSRFAQPQANISSSAPLVLPYPEKTNGMDQETSSLAARNDGLCGVINIDSSGLLLPATVSNVGTPSTETDLTTTMPSADSGFQNSPYFGYMQDSSELLHNTGPIDQPNPNRTFVKVYKSGSVGRSLDITRFNNYPELKKELGQMFNIQGLLADPQRSGWQLVFVDRENDVLLLGDGPWEAFVNSVWYIKILSPEDVQNLGKQELDNFSQNSSEQIGNDSRDLSGLPPINGFT
ncbi:hypothetical protein M8C21_012196 [Ambrosia artemisiifolia]|uniref:Auxin-responsive protein n=1 Tax=Ambrosia artemisiifolia TaxID=4212 RepID=A0AAD5GBP0_AMBAR|nr:hypothetical protein M8C21_012196 [Ambrosia artemisiifolia]